jgi:hypothetical protein
MNLVQQVAKRLKEIQVQIDALTQERDELRGAATGKVVAKAAKADKKKASPNKGSKALSSAASAVWEDVKALLKAGKITENNRAARAAYYKKHPKELEAWEAKHKK